MRYVGQSFQVDVRLPDTAIEAHDIAAMHAAFHEEHERIYSHADKAAPVEFVDLRMRVRGSMSIPRPTTPETSGVGDALKAVRSMRFHNKLIPEVRVFDRGSLTPTMRSRGRPSSSSVMRRSSFRRSSLRASEPMAQSS